MIFLFINAIESESDRSLAEKLYIDFRQTIYETAYGYLKDEARAEDAVCDVLERICKNIEQYRDLNLDKTRLLIIVYTRNICRNILKRDKTILFENPSEHIPAKGGQPEAILLDSDSYERIYTLIEKLDSKYSDVCKLKFFAGLNDIEIAAALDISHENVRVRLTRSREMIRQQLSDEVSMV